MKITYTFDTLDENFDPDELIMVQRAHNFYCALFDIDQLCRIHEKYENNPYDPLVVDKLIEEIRNKCTESGMRDLS